MAMQSSGIGPDRESSESDLEDPGFLPPGQPRSPQHGPSWESDATRQTAARPRTQETGTITEQPGPSLNKTTSTTDLSSGYYQVSAWASPAHTDFFLHHNSPQSDSSDSDFELLDPREPIPPLVPNGAGSQDSLYHPTEGPDLLIPPSPSTQEGYRHPGIQEGNTWRDQATWLQIQHGIVDNPNLFPLVRDQPQSLFMQPTARLSNILRRREDTLETPELDAFVNN